MRVKWMNVDGKRQRAVVVRKNKEKSVDTAA